MSVPLPGSKPGLNRNIVECKVARAIWNVVSVEVLIETLWNVKDAWRIRTLQESGGINRNIVECKGGHIVVLVYCCRWY